MRRIVAIAALSVGFACSSEGIELGEQESLEESSQNLNGSFSDEGFLTLKDPGLSNNEVLRRKDTFGGALGDNFTGYYESAATRIDFLGRPSESIKPGLDTLEKFKTRYGFPANSPFEEVVAYYYNKADLGLGREMHCTQTSFGEVACYVVNYAAGDDFGEFTFGLGSGFAFANMNADPPKVLATVAMVYRFAAVAPADKMLFMAYNANGQLADNAPLDRHGITFAKEFDANGGATNPTDTERFGIPGENFNNHIPSNCLNCHGGQYSTSTHSVGTASVFLPWDLDQFEYQETAGRTRDSQQDEFRALNALARSIASSVQGTTSPLLAQINRWYDTAGGGALAGNFNSEDVPPDWSGAPNVYLKVVRGCRGCHLARPDLAFDSSANFIGFATLAANDIANHSMPHALQSQREFWLSSQPVLLEEFFRNNSQTAPANTLRDANSKNIVTLDPPLISAAVF